MFRSSTKSAEMFKFGIGIKLGILLAIFGVLASGLTGYYTFNTTRDILSKKATQNMITSAQVLGRRFSTMGKTVEDDALFFAQSYLVLQAANNLPDGDLFRKTLADQFVSLLSVHAEYFQIRLISANDYGIELVRVDRDGENISIIGRQNLQEKQHYPYVYETLKLTRGKTYFSKIFINREKGVHAGYDQPTLQVATPVIGKDGIALAVIVINVDLNKMFLQLKTDLEQQYQLYLANQSGDYLMHPDKSLTFGFDFGVSYLVQDDFKATSEIISGQSQTVAVQGFDNSNNSQMIGGFTQVLFGNQEYNRFVIFGLTAPLDFVLAETSILYKNGSLIVGAFSLLAIILSGLITRVIIQPIKQLVQSVKLFTANQQPAPLNISSKDEIGLLAGSIGKMQTDIHDQIRDLNDKNNILNQEIYERKKIERYEKFRSHVLEVLANQEPLEVILKAVVEGVEKINNKTLCSILLLDEEGKHLGQGIAPSLPDFYNERVNGLEIGMAAGSCGTAAFIKKRVIVEDIQSHPYWAKYKELASSAGLRSCWSQPIFSSSDEVIGTFAIYSSEINTPSDSDIEIIEQSARLVSIAIEHKGTEDEINKLAFYDSLTQLPNRRLLLDRLEQAVASLAHSGKGASLLFIDMDKFKVLNDSFGHDMGDQLLQQVAQRLKSCVRESDTVSRLSGDEFVVVLLNLDDEAIVTAAQTEQVGKKILSSLSQPYELSLCRYIIYPSIGAVLFDGTVKDTNELLKKADMAMYLAKKAGGKELYFFDHKMQQTLMNRSRMEAELQNAMNNKEQFQLYYQPQVDLNGQVIGAEALIRWISPERGMISPLEFISIAEDSGLIIPIGRWVLETACKQLAEWSSRPQTEHLTLSVNLSAIQLRASEFINEILAIVDESGINPVKLKLEITESILLENMDDIIKKMDRLKNKGMNFSIDDFGTGYSSLQYLKCLPLDQLKIDQSFVRDLANNNNDRTIVRTIIAMANSMNLDVIAEGVETEEQFKLLINKGCKLFQGFMFGKPVPIEEFNRSLNNNY